ncbi:MAG: phosphotransferase, partial [Marmoricola sp.]
RTFVAAADAWLADRRPPLGLVHGDFRLDNLLFTADGCTVVDWQTMTWGPAVMDASYFLGGGLSVADRREHEERLVRAYHDELLANGVQNFSWETCWTEYRRLTFLALVMVFVPAMVVVRTDRGDEMFMVLFDRVCQQILDLDSLSLLPEPGTKPVPLVPDAADETLHAPGVEPLWNESWYFDAVSSDGSLGLYVRLGRLPNADACVYTASVVRPGEPTLMVVDYSAPLPAADDPLASIATAAIRATHTCVTPLEEFRIDLDATAEAYADAAGVLRGEAGDPVPVRLSLSWTTQGAPYAWRASTRYEIPCRVTGTVVIDGTEVTFEGPGQRDHSWGSRDWWANDWMWSAFHLDDGTRTHAVTAPEIPGFAVGYEQRDGVVVELESGSTEQSFGDDGLVTVARIATEPGGTVLDVAPLAFGPLLLTAPDGRVTHFQRAMAKVTTADGRSGLGWIEWNRVQG